MARKMNKEKFLKTELGAELHSTIMALDFYLEHQHEEKDSQHIINELFACWNVFKLALKHIYGLDYTVSRTDEYIGVCLEVDAPDEADYLFKISRIEPEEKVQIVSGWGKFYDWELVQQHMDKELAERLHSELAPCPPQKFYGRYAFEHLQKFGEEFIFETSLHPDF